ncbi:MAG: hypothetical protein V2A58_09910 [Planctomycetota bacterium]
MPAPGDIPPVLVAIFAERDLADTPEKQEAAQGRLAPDGVLANILRHLRTLSVNPPLLLRFFGNVGPKAWQMQTVRPLLLALGRKTGRDVTDPLRHSVRSEAFRHPTLGNGTVVVIRERDAPPVAAPPAPATAAPKAPPDDFLSAAFIEEPEGSGPVSAAPAPGLPRLRDHAPGVGKDEPVHFIIFLETPPADEKERRAILEQRAALPGGALETVLRRKLRLPPESQCQVNVFTREDAGRWSLSEIQSYVVASGRPVGRDYSHLASFRVRSRTFDDPRTGKFLLVTVLARTPAADEDRPIPPTIPVEEEALEQSLGALEFASEPPGLPEEVEVSDEFLPAEMQGPGEGEDIPELLVDLEGEKESGQAPPATAEEPAEEELPVLEPWEEEEAAEEEQLPELALDLETPAPTEAEAPPEPIPSEPPVLEEETPAEESQPPLPLVEEEPFEVAQDESRPVQEVATHNEEEEEEEERPPTATMQLPSVDDTFEERTEELPQVPQEMPAIGESPLSAPEPEEMPADNTAELAMLDEWLREEEAAEAPTQTAHEAVAAESPQLSPSQELHPDLSTSETAVDLSELLEEDADALSEPEVPLVSEENILEGTGGAAILEPSADLERAEPPSAVSPSPPVEDALATSAAVAEPAEMASVAEGEPSVAPPLPDLLAPDVTDVAPEEEPQQEEMATRGHPIIARLEAAGDRLISAMSEDRREEHDALVPVLRELLDAVQSAADYIEWPEPGPQPDERAPGVYLARDATASVLLTRSFSLVRLRAGDRLQDAEELLPQDLEPAQLGVVTASLWFLSVAAVARRAETNRDEEVLSPLAAVFIPRLPRIWWGLASRSSAVRGARDVDSAAFEQAGLWDTAKIAVVSIADALAEFHRGDLLLRLAQTRQFCGVASAAAPYLALVRDVPSFQTAWEQYSERLLPELDLVALLATRSSVDGSLPALLLRVELLVAGLRSADPAELGALMEDLTSVGDDDALRAIRKLTEALGEPAARESFRALARICTAQAVRDAIQSLVSTEARFPIDALRPLSALRDLGLLEAAREEFQRAPRPSLLDLYAAVGPAQAPHAISQLLEWASDLPEPAWQEELARACAAVHPIAAIRLSIRAVVRERKAPSERFLYLLLPETDKEPAQELAPLVFLLALRLSFSNDAAIARGADRRLSALMRLVNQRDLHERLRAEPRLVRGVLASCRSQLFEYPLEDLDSFLAQARLLGACLLLPRRAKDSALLRLLWKAPDEQSLLAFLAALQDSGRRSPWQFVYEVLSGHDPVIPAWAAHSRHRVTITLVLFKALAFPDAPPQAAQTLLCLAPDFPRGAQQALRELLPSADAEAAHVRRLATVSPAVAESYLRNARHDHPSAQPLEPGASAVPATQALPQILDRLLSDDPLDRIAAVRALDACTAEPAFFQVLDQWLARLDASPQKATGPLAQSLLLHREIHEEREFEWRMKILSHLDPSREGLSVVLGLLLNVSEPQLLLRLLQKLQAAQPSVPWQLAHDVLSGRPGPAEVFDPLFGAACETAYAVAFALLRATQMSGKWGRRAARACDPLATRHFQAIVAIIPPFLQGMSQRLELLPDFALLRGFLDVAARFAPETPMVWLRDAFGEGSSDLAWVARTDSASLRIALAFALRALEFQALAKPAVALLSEIAKTRATFLREEAGHDDLVRGLGNALLASQSAPDQRERVAALLASEIDACRPADAELVRRLAELPVLDGFASDPSRPRELLDELIHRWRQDQRST